MLTGPPSAEGASAHAGGGKRALSEAAQAGSSFYGDNDTSASIDGLAGELGEALALPLRERVSASLREAAGDDEALADGVRAAYRDWKAHRIGMQTRDTVFAAFNLGLYEATPAGAAAVAGRRRRVTLSRRRGQLARRARGQGRPVSDRPLLPAGASRLPLSVGTTASLRFLRHARW